MLFWNGDCRADCTAINAKTKSSQKIYLLILDCYMSLKSHLVPNGVYNAPKCTIFMQEIQKMLCFDMSNSSLFTPALLRTHSKSFVFFAVHETRRIFLSPSISKSNSERRVSSFYLRVQISQPYTLLQPTVACSF